MSKITKVTKVAETLKQSKAKSVFSAFQKTPKKAKQSKVVSKNPKIPVKSKAKLREARRKPCSHDFARAPRTLLDLPDDR